MASQLASELGRLATTSVLPPSASHSAATFLSSSALLAASTTLPPAPASTLAASAPKAPDAPVTIAVLPLMSNSAVGFFRKSSDMGFPCFSVRVFGKAGAGGWGWTRARSRIPHPAALRAATLPEDGEGEVTSLRRGHRHEHRHDVIAAVDDLALFVGADEAAVVRLEHDVLAPSDDGQFARQDYVNLLGRRGVRAGAAAGQEVRQPDHELLRPAGIEPEQAQRRVVAVVGRLIGFRLGKAFDLHLEPLPFFDPV